MAVDIRTHACAWTPSVTGAPRVAANASATGRPTHELPEVVDCLCFDSLRRLLVAAFFEQAHGGLGNECPIDAGSGGAVLVAGAAMEQRS